MKQYIGLKEGSALSCVFYEELKMAREAMYHRKYITTYYMGIKRYSMEVLISVTIFQWRNSILFVFLRLMAGKAGGEMVSVSYNSVGIKRDSNCYEKAAKERNIWHF